MIIGQTIVAVDMGSQETTTVYSPWIATWGNGAIFPYEILQAGGVIDTLSVQVFTKNSEQADPGTQAGSTDSQSSPGTYSIDDATDLLELVRLKFILTPNAANDVYTAFVHLRALNPSWKTN